MIIPETITIKLVNRIGEPQQIANVFMGLKIYISENSYHTFSIMATDSNGEIQLSKDEIIENTEINESILSGNPTSFEFYIWERDTLLLVKSRIENLLKMCKDEDSVMNELKSIGIADSNISTELEKIRLKELEDRNLFEQLSKSANHNLVLFDSKISGTWETGAGQEYELVTERKNDK
jgi:hypothetical protein